MAERLALTEADVLVVVDVQNDFLPGGALAVPDGDAVVAPANALGRRFAHVVLTQDWHPAGHLSFASSHPGKAVFDTVDLPYGAQVLWPDHCVQGSRGAALADALDLAGAELVIRKGFNRAVDSYSAFLEADKATSTGLGAYLRARGFRRVFVCGLATDYCAGWTAVDARNEGFETFVVDDAVRGIHDATIGKAWADMAAAGVARLTSDAIL